MSRILEHDWPISYDLKPVALKSYCKHRFTRWRLNNSLLSNAPIISRCSQAFPRKGRHLHAPSGIRGQVSSAPRIQSFLSSGTRLLSSAFVEVRGADPASTSLSSCSFEVEIFFQFINKFLPNLMLILDLIRLESTFTRYQIDLRV